MLNVNVNGVCDSPTTTTQGSRNMITWLGGQYHNIY